ncbi:MAG: ATP-dependent DNA helicase DinG, partial [Halioglobus sp.]|nr:ATP-dependent DNA helicase DinG [Halioglobus sp.]
MSEDIKGSIRDAYNAIVESKSLTPRWGQRQMIAEIANTLSRIPAVEGEDSGLPAVCVIEAGTGTGKTIAYAVAAIPMAQALGKRLVVATATIALQEQFVNKDLPDIRQSSGMNFSFALAKGRRRYVCLSKLDRQLAEGQGASSLIPLYPDEFDAPSGTEALPIYDAMLQALGRGEWDGDRDNWPDSVPEEVWYGATTDHSQCSGRRCPNISQCSFYRARDELQSADIIVTNHDLVLSDLALGGGAILSAPEDSIYVFDEGHHLPDKALSHFSSYCRLNSTITWLQDSKKTLAQGAPALATIDSVHRQLQALPPQLDEAVAALQVAEQTVAALFEETDLPTHRDEQQLRLEHGLVPASLVQIAKTLSGQFQQLSTTFSRMESVLEDALDDEHAGLEKSDLET